MKICLKALIAATIILAGASAALAEEGDKYSYFLGSYVEPDSALNFDDGYGLQIGIGNEMTKLWNLEGYIQYTRNDGSPSLANSTVGADLQLVINRDHAFEPYLFAGIGYHDSKVGGMGDDQAAVQAAGIGFRAALGDRGATLRVEYRYRAYDVFAIDMNDQLYSLGIQMPFGKKSPPPAVPVRARDSDGDGVDDDRDRCPNTPAGVSVDADGCAIDSDGDGVADHIDQCPGTVRGAIVDDKGCELDGDSDGVVDRLDQCPDSEAGVQVDINGCEIKEEIRLPGVTFESNSDRLLPGAESVLNDAAATLKKNPEIKVEVAGHTDSDGAADYNESLSARRAATVRDYLLNRGVSEDAMTSRGYGESQPVADNGTAEGKATNRRVVLRITER